MLLNCFVDFADKIINLSFDRAHIDIRVEQACRSYNLLCPKKFVRLLILARGGGDEHDLIDVLLELFEIERTVIQSARQTEPIVDESGLAAPVTIVHRADLRDCHVGFVYYN